MPNENNRVEDSYTPEQTRTLCGAVIEAIADYRGTDPHTDDFVLYEYTDPDAITKLFQHDANQNHLLQFTADDAQITLEGNDTVEISVNRLPDGQHSLQK
ncbi:hypothetical protein HUG10_20175 (plasmid) [Halorarum halophilum]|uniref:Halobacterial output domain-containing protein n=1 Tax=Halorarum halophilum TaxID=2743090 RepID=A0A7D5GEM7_9EURY|nr:HalOD1 output domain-containing protein [Halobaculum halophilum]QLG29925.1 hypothetical protein HUG10_20175 [Halobaculum halophilum]